jgi:hypothetical protein
LWDVPLIGFGKPQFNSYLIFPYKIEAERAVLYSTMEMAKKFPGCWEYLRAYKDLLDKRNMPSRLPANWYQYGRSQSLTKFDGRPKLIWPVLSLEPKYAYDDQDIMFTGGGNGPYYALSPKEGVIFSIFFLQAILSHPLIEAMVQSRASTFRGGYGSHGKQFIQDLPICLLDPSNPEHKKAYTDVVKLAKQLIHTTSQWSKATVPTRKNLLNQQRTALKQQINRLLETLYGIIPADLETLAAFPVATGEREEDLKS